MVMKKHSSLIIGVIVVIVVIIVGVILYKNYQKQAEVVNSPATVGQDGDCVIDWSKAYGSNPSNIDSELEKRLCTLSEQTGTKIIPNAGYRTAAEQQALSDELLQGNPSYYRDDEGAVRNSEGLLVAEAAGDSYHETGDAVDVNRNGVSGQFYTDDELAKAGLTNRPTIRTDGKPTFKEPEPWHLTLDPDYSE
jgi:hypothetical protein